MAHYGIIGPQFFQDRDSNRIHSDSVCAGDYNVGPGLLTRRWAAVDKCLQAVHDDELGRIGGVDLGDHQPLVGRAVEVPHQSFRRCSHGELQRHGKDASVLVRLQTAGSDDVLRFDERLGHKEPLGPMIPRRIKVPPIGFRQVFEIDDLKSQLLGQGKNSLVLHHLLCRRRAAPLAQGDPLCAPGLDLPDERSQRIVVRSGRKRVGGVKVGFEEDAFSLHRREVEKADCILDP